MPKLPPHACSTSPLIDMCVVGAQICSGTSHYTETEPAVIKGSPTQPPATLSQEFWTDTHTKLQNGVKPVANVSGKAAALGI